MEDKAVSFWDFTQGVDGRLYVSSAFSNGLCEIDMQPARARHIAFFKNVSPFRHNLHGKMYEWGDWLYFFPLSTEYEAVDCWNKRSGAIKQLPFPAQKAVKIHRRYEYARIGGKVWIVPREFEIPILCFSLETETFEKKLDWNRKLSRCGRRVEPPHFLSMAVSENSLFFPLRGTAAAAQLDTNTGKITIHQLPDKSLRLELMEYKEPGTFALTSMGTADAFLWHSGEDRLERYQMTEQTGLRRKEHDLSQAENCESGAKRSYKGMFCSDGNVFLIPSDRQSLRYMDGDQGVVIPFGEPLNIMCPALASESGETRLFGIAGRYGDKVLICPGDTGTLLIVDPNLPSVTDRQIWLPKETLLEKAVAGRVRSELLSGNDIIEEDEGFACLDALLLALSEGPLPERTHPPIEPCGAKIHEWMKRQLN